ncbi:MAG: 8-amino-7-oxononanoate synthase [Bacteroidetes bacterium]|nr:8-amino-7-oxononanoate synthase [Bacteroidota bacterium]
MSKSIQQYILSKLEQRKQLNNFRALRVTKGLVDFYSNDYLGFARDENLKALVAKEIKTQDEAFLGSTGSRLLSGNSEYAEQLEMFIADYHGAEAALIFNSGFDANYGLLSSLPYRGDTIIYDELVHASIHDGIRNSKANAVSFAHNNVENLEQKLKTATGLKYVVVESVYSMDGDFAPLNEIAALCKKYEAGLMVDEAHATGIAGTKGEGRVTSEIQNADVLARVHTFSKALGAHGAVVLCSKELKEFLINYCRPFIFSTALPFYSLAAVKCSYEFLSESRERREKLFALNVLFKKQTQPKENFQLIASDSPVQSIVVSGNQNVKNFATKIQEQGFDVRPILYPTVPKGKERIRICLHSFNTEEEVSKLAAVINAL